MFRTKLFINRMLVETTSNLTLKSSGSLCSANFNIFRLLLCRELKSQNGHWTTAAYTNLFWSVSAWSIICTAWRDGIEYLNEKRLKYIDSFIGQLCSRHTGNQVSLSIGQHFYATTKKIQKSVLSFIFSSYDILKLVWLETLSCVTGLHLSRPATLISTL